MSSFEEMGLDILASCCGDDRVLDAVRYVGIRYDGQDSQLPLQGAKIPLAARMITIVDAYDAMTTDQVYRPAKSRERAMNELFELGGSQFDPALVKQFVESITKNQGKHSEAISQRWLGKVAKQTLPWKAPESAAGAVAAVATPAAPAASRSWLEEKLIEAMHDGVVFVDSQARITLWSKGDRATHRDKWRGSGRPCFRSDIARYVFACRSTDSR